MAGIPASSIVSVTANVISAGGSALDFNAMVISKNVRIPSATVLEFPNATAVAKYFGAGTAEAQCASIYFAGFDGSNRKPGNILFTLKNAGALPAFLRGGDVSALTLSQLQALTGIIQLNANGTNYTSSTINLSAATSFSNAATIIQAAYTTPPFTVTYDAIAGAFTFTNTSTGTASTITTAQGTGSISGGLALTAGKGAITSQGAAIASNEITFMTALAARSQNWVTFMTLADPDSGSGNSTKANFATWATTQNKRYLYVCWDTDATAATTVPATTSLGYQLNLANADGTMLIYAPDFTQAAFVCGAIASIDFEQTNGRTTLAFRSQAGLAPYVTDATTAANLQLNGYNYYGQFATANDGFTFLYPGSVTGSFDFTDSYINQIWLNNQFQLALMLGLTQVKSIPYNPYGYSLIRAFCQDPINQGLNFGAFRPNVTLSAAQIVEVNTLVGVSVDKELAAKGYLLYIADASPQVRAARGSPQCTFLYLDGGSIQRINLNSTLIQ